MEKLIQKLKSSIQPYFGDKISIHKDGFGIYRLTSNYLSEAKDLHGNYFDNIKVVKWIDGYWIKIGLNFKKIEIETTFKSNKTGINKDDYLAELEKHNLKLNSDFFELKISVSLFVGEDDTFSKTQLFRAEWDNYDSKQDKHPQPHWQFYQFNEYRQKLDSLVLVETEGFNSEEEDQQGFVNSLKTNFDFKKFHFAMNGNWINNETHIHSLNSEEKIIRWFRGLLFHLTTQLEYVKKE